MLSLPHAQLVGAATFSQPLLKVQAFSHRSRHAIPGAEVTLAVQADVHSKAADTGLADLSRHRDISTMPAGQ